MHREVLRVAGIDAGSIDRDGHDLAMLQNEIDCRRRVSRKTKARDVAGLVSTHVAFLVEIVFAPSRARDDDRTVGNRPVGGLVRRDIIDAEHRVGVAGGARGEIDHGGGPDTIGERNLVERDPSAIEMARRVGMRAAMLRRRVISRRVEVILTRVATMLQAMDEALFVGPVRSRGIEGVGEVDDFRGIDFQGSSELALLASSGKAKWLSSV